MLSNPPPADTSAPVWDSTAANSSSPVTPRVGVQSVVESANIGEVIIHWDVGARSDASRVLQYLLEHKRIVRNIPCDE